MANLGLIDLRIYLKRFDSKPILLVHNLDHNPDQDLEHNCKYELARKFDNNSNNWHLINFREDFLVGDFFLANKLIIFFDRFWVKKNFESQFP